MCAGIAACKLVFNKIRVMFKEFRYTDLHFGWVFHIDGDSTAALLLLCCYQSPYCFRYCIFNVRSSIFQKYYFLLLF